MTSKSTWIQQDNKIATCRVTWPDLPHHCSIFVHPWYLFFVVWSRMFFKPQVTHKCAARLWNMCVMSWISVNSEVLIKSNPQTLRYKPRRSLKIGRNCPKRKWIIFQPLNLSPSNPHKFLLLAIQESDWKRFSLRSQCRIRYPNSSQ